MTAATRASLAQVEIQRRYQLTLDAFTPVAIADGHTYQLRALTSTVQNLLLMCSRRAGKTYLCCALLALVAAKSKKPVSCLYLALTSGQAKKVWRRTWKGLCRRFKLCKPTDHAETDMVTTFPNGSTVQFGGTDDMRHVQSLLGDSMAGGMAVVDECQSDPGLMESLVIDILAPMLDETSIDHPEPGRLVLAGTVPLVAGGYFYKLWADNYDEVQDKPKDDAVWLPIGWGRADNPHTTYFRERLDSYLAKYNLEESDPIVQRNWYGHRVFDTNSTAYRYDKAKNRYEWTRADWARPDMFAPGTFTVGQTVAGLDTFAIGLDPAATSDRFGIVLWGWSSSNPAGIWQVAEWVTEKGANALESQYMAVIQALVKRYNVVAIIRDAGSASTTLDPAFLSEYGLVIEPAKKGKGSIKARVDRFKDLLGTGRAHIMSGSALETDLVLARFDPEKRALGKYDWTSDCHPDVADAGSYAIPAYIEAIKGKVRPGHGQTADIPQTGAWVLEQERLASESWKPKTGQYGEADPNDVQFEDGSSYGGHEQG